MTATLYNPWSEDGAALRSRHVGRTEELDAITSGVRRALRGERPLPVYLWGPRGVGKSHLLALAADEVKEEVSRAGWGLSVITEDVPTCSDADALWQRWMVDPNVPAWVRLLEPASAVSVRPRVVFIEGLDVHLAALGESGRRALRARLDQNRAVFLVASGSRVDDSLLSQESAFYGWFDIRGLRPLATPESTDLLGALARPVAEGTVSVDPRRFRAVETLAGGSPRALVALAQAILAAPSEDLSSRLLALLDDVTAHYQVRWRDLSPAEQRLVELLALMPRGLGPTDAADMLGGVPSSWSTCANRLAHSGVLDVSHTGRHANYRITEPLFRFWLEYRQSPWNEARIAWLGNLLEMLLGPEEIVQVALGEGAGADAAMQVVATRAKVRQAAVARTVDELIDALRTRDGGAALRLCERVLTTTALKEARWPVAFELLLHVDAYSNPDGVRCQERVAAAFEELSPWMFELLRATQPRAILRELALGARRDLDGLRPGWREGLFGFRLVERLERALDGQKNQGRPWELSEEERRELAGFPALRLRLHQYGRQPTQAAPLRAEDLLTAEMRSNDSDLTVLLHSSVARREFAVARRVLGYLSDSSALRLPRCPWPGRRLPTELSGWVRAVRLGVTVSDLTWVAALSDASEADFVFFLDRLGSGVAGWPEDRIPNAGRDRTALQLAFAGLATHAPVRFEALAERLGTHWAPIVDRVRLLLRQLAERARGPLHPELARIDQALRERLEEVSGERLPGGT